MAAWLRATDALRSPLASATEGRLHARSALARPNRQRLYGRRPRLYKNLYGLMAVVENGNVLRVYSAGCCRERAKSELSDLIRRGRIYPYHFAWINWIR